MYRSFLSEVLTKLHAICNSIQHILDDSYLPEEADIRPKLEEFYNKYKDYEDVFEKEAKTFVTYSVAETIVISKTIMDINRSNFELYEVLALEGNGYILEDFEELTEQIKGLLVEALLPFIHYVTNTDY